MYRPTAEVHNFSSANPRELSFCKWLTKLCLRRSEHCTHIELSSTIPQWGTPTPHKKMEIFFWKVTIGFSDPLILLAVVMYTIWVDSFALKSDLLPNFQFQKWVEPAWATVELSWFSEYLVMPWLVSTEILRSTCLLSVISRLQQAAAAAALKFKFDSNSNSKDSNSNHLKSEI